MPYTKNIAELRSFLGMVNYYDRFTPDLATKCAILNDLLHKGSPWCWTVEHSQAVDTIKEALTSENSIHKPLLTIFHPTKGIPETAATHLQRWAIILSAYDYVIQYKLTAKHGNADRLSRLPLNVTKQNDKSEDADIICAIEEQQLDCLPIQACDIQKATTQDPVLSQVYIYTLNGWPTSSKALPDKIKPFSTNDSN